MTDCGYQAPPRKWPGTTLSDYRPHTARPDGRVAARRHDGLRTHPHAPPRAPRRRPRPDHVDPQRARCAHQERRGPRARSACSRQRSGRHDCHHLRIRLPELTRGEGVIESTFAGHRPVQGAPPSRPRTDRNHRPRRLPPSPDPQSLSAGSRQLGGGVRGRPDDGCRVGPGWPSARSTTSTVATARRAAATAAATCRVGVAGDHVDRGEQGDAAREHAHHSSGDRRQHLRGGQRHGHLARRRAEGTGHRRRMPVVESTVAHVMTRRR